uniref:Bm936 n=1 Tax=Brugia malayi TaxID=6279 RepID=A0A1I9G5P8_BRUMA|nr:Bm936 [Brugia malayi]
MVKWLPKPDYSGTCRGARSLADDLITGQGVVSSRAASILRSVETYPLIGRFVFFFFLFIYTIN